MTFQAVTGRATSIEAREAAVQATRQALELLGKKKVALGFIVASYHFPFQQILSGITSLLGGDTPLFGFSTTAEFSMDGVAHRSVVVTLVSGNDLQVRADWWPRFENGSSEFNQKMILAFQQYQTVGALLVAADGLNSDIQQICANLPSGTYPLVGCLASGDLRSTSTSQMGGKKAGSGGLAAASLSGDIIVGIGHSHAWRPVGVYFTITGVRGPMILSLDHQPANEIYARLFGNTPQDWTISPLNELVRLYPLGLEQDGQTELLIRAPLRFEADGSLRMNTPIQEGSVGHLMVGSTEECCQSAADASRQALAQLGGAQPVFAIVFADVAVQMLLEAQPGSELEAVQSVLGREVPVVGGYTFGQIARNNTGMPELLNQHISVIVFGDKGNA
jgi:hypothetical protein